MSQSDQEMELEWNVPEKKAKKLAHSALPHASLCSLPLTPLNAPMSLCAFSLHASVYLLSLQSSSIPPCAPSCHPLYPSTAPLYLSFVFSTPSILHAHSVSLPSPLYAPPCHLYNTLCPLHVPPYPSVLLHTSHCTPSVSSTPLCPCGPLCPCTILHPSTPFWYSSMPSLSLFGVWRSLVSSPKWFLIGQVSGPHHIHSHSTLERPHLHNDFPLPPLKKVPAQPK